MQEKAAECSKFSAEQRNAVAAIATTVCTAQKWAVHLEAAQSKQQDRSAKLSTLLKQMQGAADSTSLCALHEKKRQALCQQHENLQDHCKLLQNQVASLESQVGSSDSHYLQEYLPWMRKIQHKHEY